MEHPKMEDDMEQPTKEDGSSKESIIVANRTALISCLVVLLAIAVALPQLHFHSTPKLSNAQTSLTLLFQNNLNASDDINHVGAILLDEFPPAKAAGACATLNETLITRDILQEHEDDFVRLLSYQSFAGRAGLHQLYQINGSAIAATNIGKLSIQSVPAGVSLPVLCTQSSRTSQPSVSTSDSTDKITIESGGNFFLGFRNQKSFRFLGIPYADEPARFEYSKVFSKTGQTVQAMSYGSSCAQLSSSGSEICHFINIQTPYIPKAGSTSNLRPVMFWIHGGGFLTGTGADPLSDGGNLASREDIVVVTFNYRLSTLGFLAVPGTRIKGNFGIADQVVALQWTINHIAAFGGDPTKITIVGESAGAGSVRVLLGSPPAIGKFRGAIAMSNLGGGVTLGLSGGFATPFSSYLTISQSYDKAGQKVFSKAGCNQTNLDAQIACIKTIPALALVDLPVAASYVVQDGTYVNTEQLIVSIRNDSTAHVPVIFGIMADDGASFATYPSAPVTSLLQGLEVSLGISKSAAQSIISSKLFPFYDTGNLTLDSFNVSSRVSTDLQFRCVDEATLYAGVASEAFPTAFYYEFARGISGYDPNGVGNPPATPEFPHGDPSLSYFKVHAADMSYTFGNLSPDLLRDDKDLWLAQLATSYWAEFVRTGQPNPSIEYLKVRRYDKVLEAIEEQGPWNPVQANKHSRSTEILDWPIKRDGWIDIDQCVFLNYSLTYYLESNRG